jgi:membrane protease YdiL (CAAX protease family)
MRRHPLLFFFLLAFGFSWLYSLPYMLSQETLGVLPFHFSPLYLAFVTFGPALSALLMTGILEGKAGIAQLLRHFILWRVGFRWYLLALIGVPALVLLTFLVLPGALTVFKGAALGSALLSYPAQLAFFFAQVGPGEETGWRGFALPRLQQRSGPLWGSLILGALWAAWHMPAFLIAGHLGGPGVSVLADLRHFAMFFFSAIPLTIVMTWVFNHTRWSLLISGLFHAANDASFALAGALGLFSIPLLAPEHATYYLTGLVSMGVVALLVVVLTRGCLSYQRDLRETTPLAPEAVVEQGPAAPGKTM